MSTKKAKRIMRSFKLEEISGVTVPAQSPALVDIMKSAGEISVPAPGETSDDIAAAVCHVKNGDGDMPDENAVLQQMQKMSDDIARISAQVSGGFEVEEIEHMGELAGDELASFISAAPEERAEKLTTNRRERMNERRQRGAGADDQDPKTRKGADMPAEVLYKTADGIELTAEDGQAAVALAKSLDAANERAKKAEADVARLLKAAELAEIRTEARSTFGKMAGSDEAKIALAKAMRAIEDEALRADVVKMITAGFSEFGDVTKTPGVVSKDGGPMTKASMEDAIQKCADEYGKANNISSPQDAYARFMGTPEGIQMYDEMMRLEQY